MGEGERVISLFVALSRPIYKPVPRFSSTPCLNLCVSFGDFYV